jgi:putative transcriptional regulator
MNAFEKKIAARLQRFVDALEEDTDLTESFNCRTVVLDLEPTEYEPEKVIQTRKLLGASQVVFARFLGVSVQTVRAWEQGVNSPSDMACRFMDEIRLDIAHWQKRLKESVKVKTPRRS